MSKYEQLSNIAAQYGFQLISADKWHRRDSKQLYWLLFDSKTGEKREQGTSLDFINPEGFEKECKAFRAQLDDKTPKMDRFELMRIINGAADDIQHS